MEKATILNIGTKILTADVMDHFLRSFGQFKTHYAANAKSARRILERLEYVDMVILEFDLPDESPYRLLKELKTNPEWDHLYYVLGADSEEPYLKYLIQDLDCDDVLTKPFNAENLKALLDRFENFEEDQDSARRLIRKAEIAFRDRWLNKVDLLYEQALKHDPTNERAMTKAAAYFLMKPDWKQCEFLLTEALVQNSDYVPALALQAELAWKKKDYEKAIDYFFQAQKRCPLNPFRNVQMMNFALDWSADQLRTALRVDQDNPELYFELGKALMMRKNYLDACKAFQRVNFAKEHPAFQAFEEYAKLAKKLGGLK